MSKKKKKTNSLSMKRMAEGWKRAQEANEKDLITKAMVYGIQRASAKTMSPSDAAEFLKRARRLSLVNRETFFAIDPSDRADIGTYAFNTCEGDFTKFSSTVLKLMNMYQSRGDTTIDVTTVIVYYSIFNGYKIKTPQFVDRKLLKMSLESFAASLLTVGRNPFKITVFEPSHNNKLFESLGLEKPRYFRKILKLVIKLIGENKVGYGLHYPVMDYIIPVVDNPRNKQLEYLQKLFQLRKFQVEEIFGNVKDLTTANEEMMIAWNKATDGFIYNLEMKAILQHLKRLEDTGILMPTFNRFEIYDHFAKYDKVDVKHLRKLRIAPRYVYDGFFWKDVFQHNAEIRVPCGRYKTVEEIKPYIQAAAQMHILRLRDFDTNRTKSLNKTNDRMQARLLITLSAVKDCTTFFVKEVKEVLESIRSLYNRDFYLQIEYNPYYVSSGLGRDLPEYVRVISDIHCDVNKDKGYLFDFKDDFVINCGDTGSNVKEARNWIRTNMRRGVVVAGNHLGYTHSYPEKDGAENFEEWGNYVHPWNTKNVQIKELMETFKRITPVTALSNTVKETDGMIIIGTTLYTDFKLFGEDNKPMCVMEAAHKLNDFRYCSYFINKAPKGAQRDCYVEKYSTSHYLLQHNLCCRYLKAQLEKYKKKKRVILAL